MKKIKNNFICFGAVHHDYVFELKNDLIKYRTNPIKHNESYGGVAHNVARAISCLLYTSPSPRDGLLSRMPSSA